MLIIGGGSGGGDGVPVGSIIISGKDMTEEGYGRLDTPLTLHKDNEPKLWEIYKETGGLWLTSGVNIVNNAMPVLRIADSLFMIINEDGTINVFSNFDGSDTVKLGINSSVLIGANYVSAVDDKLLFSAEGQELAILEFDSKLESITEIADSFNLKTWDISSLAFEDNQVYLTRKGIFIFDTITNIAKIPTDNDFGDVDKITYYDASIYPHSSDSVLTKYITFNGFYLEAGILYDLDTGNFAIANSYDHNNIFSCFAIDDDDYISYRGEIHKITKDLIIETFNFGASTTIEMSSIYKDLTFKTSLGGSGATSVSTIYTDGNSESLDASYIISTNSLTRTTYSRGARQNQFTLPGVIGFNVNGEKFVKSLIQFITEAPDIFTIDLVDQISTDKIAWIKLEEKGL